MGFAALETDEKAWSNKRAFGTAVLVTQRFAVGGLLISSAILAMITFWAYVELVISSSEFFPSAVRGRFVVLILGMAVSIAVPVALREIDRRWPRGWPAPALATPLAILSLWIVWLQATSPVCMGRLSNDCLFSETLIALPLLTTLAASTSVGIWFRRPWAWMTMAVFATGTSWFLGLYWLFGPPFFLEGMLLLFGPPVIVWSMLFLTFRDFFTEPDQPRSA